MKSIYEKAIEVLLNTGTEFIAVPYNRIGEENSDMIHLRDVTETYETNMHEVVKALEQAQKQEKLLELYKQLNIIYEKLYTMELSELALNSNYYEIELIKLKQRIKEIENDK